MCQNFNHLCVGTVYFAGDGYNIAERPLFAVRIVPAVASADLDIMYFNLVVFGILQKFAEAAFLCVVFDIKIQIS